MIIETPHDDLRMFQAEILYLGQHPDTPGDLVKYLFILADTEETARKEAEDSIRSDLYHVGRVIDLRSAASSGK